jgi:AcrR family transcriptional regulator
MTQVSSSETTGTIPATARGRATRQNLLDAAEAVFGELSFDRASVAEITRRAGVAQGTFYIYFPDKTSIFTELVRHLNHSLRQTIAIAVAGHEDRRQIERIGFQTFFEYARAHRSLYKIMREAEFVDPDVYRWHYATLAEGYIRGLEHEKAAGRLPSELDLETISNLLMGIAEFMGGWYVIRDDAELTKEAFEQVMSFVERGLGYSKGPDA